MPEGSGPESAQTKPNSGLQSKRHSHVVVVKLNTPFAHVPAPAGTDVRWECIGERICAFGFGPGRGTILSRAGAGADIGTRIGAIAFGGALRIAR